MQAFSRRIFLHSVVCAVAWTAVCGSLIAQTTDATAAHRRLDLPENGSTDQLQQMFLLKQLRSIVTGEPISESSTSPTGDSPQLQQLKQLKNMFDQFGGDIPPEMLPKPEDIPQDLIQQIQSDPQARNYVQQMLEQYKKNGQIPQGSNTSDARMPLPPSDNRNDLDGGRNSADRRQPSPIPSESDNQAGATRTDRNRSRRNSEDAQQGSGDGTPSRELSSSQAETLKRLEDMWKQATQHQSTDGSSSALSRRPEPSRPPPANPRNSDAATKAAGNWDQYLEKLIQQQRNSSPDKARSDATNGKGNENGLQIPETWRDLQNHVPSGAPNPQGAGTDRLSQSFSMEEFLREMKDVVPPLNTENRGYAQGRHGSEAEKDGTPLKDEDSAVSDENSRAQNKKIQEAASEMLKQRGFKEALRNIVRETRRSDPQARGTADAASSGVSESVRKAVKGITKDVFKIMGDGDLKLNFGDSKSDPSTAKKSEAAPEKTPPKTGIGGLIESTGEMFSEIVTPPPQPEQKATPTTPQPQNTEPLPAATEDFFPVVGLIALLVLLLAVAMFLWRPELLGRIGKLSNRDQQSAGFDVQTKGDVVRAFHRMALQPARQVQEWWTHQKATEQISEQTPETTDPVRVLAELYEQARYLPAGEEFSPEQLRKARHALSQCEGR